MSNSFDISEMDSLPEVEPAAVGGEEEARGEEAPPSVLGQLPSLPATAPSARSDKEQEHEAQSWSIQPAVRSRSALERLEDGLSRWRGNSEAILKGFRRDALDVERRKGRASKRLRPPPDTETAGPGEISVGDGGPLGLDANQSTAGSAHQSAAAAAGQSTLASAEEKPRQAELHAAVSKDETEL